MDRSTVFQKMVRQAGAAFVAGLLFCPSVMAEYQSLQTISVRAGIIFVGEAGLLQDFGAPEVVHIPVTDASEITRLLVIQGSATDDSAVSSVQLVYKNGSQDDGSVQILTVSTATPIAAPTLTGGRAAPRVGTMVTPRPFQLHSAGQMSNFQFEIPKTMVTTDGVQYRLVAVDQWGKTMSTPSASGYFYVNVSNAKRKTISQNGGLFTVADGNPLDGETSLDIPIGALGAAQDIEIRELDVNDAGVFGANDAKIFTSRPVAVYRFGPSGLVFRKPVTLTLLYPDVDNDGLIDGTNISENSAQIYNWDGYAWRPIGGTVNLDLNTVTARITHFSLYAVFPGAAPSAKDLRPMEKIITPAHADGQNDIATFAGLPAGSQVEIYDAHGRKVRTIQDIGYWDGRDDDLEIVESGVYIYQFQKDGERVSGVIAVAK